MGGPRPRLWTFLRLRHLFVLVLVVLRVKLQKFSVIFFAHESGSPSNIVAECQLHDLPSIFFFHKLFPKFIHAIWRCLVLSSCPRRLWTARYKIIYRLWFLAFFQKLITCLEYDKGGHAHGYEHFGSVGKFLLFESTFLTQKQATFQSTIVWRCPTQDESGS